MDSKIETIIVVGSGNMAYHLVRNFLAANVKVIQLIGRNQHSTAELGIRFGVPYSHKLEDLKNEADLYILAVNDDSINDLSGKINLNDRLVIHTSGSAPIDVLEPVSSNIGVFYPVQTLTAGIDIDFSPVPICLEANNDENYTRLMVLANRISNKVLKVDSRNRLIIHLSAVFANNFTNFMYGIAESLLARHNIPFDILRPLILETARKTELGEPSEIQTGPASRNDQQIIIRHLDLLADNPELWGIYSLISKNILKQTLKKNGKL